MELRERTALAHNRACNLADFDALQSVMRETHPHQVASHPHFPAGRETRKVWEVAMAVRGLRDFGALRPDAEILVVGAGRESTIFYLTNQVRRVFATDLYGDAGAWRAGAPETMLTDPERCAPAGFPWHPRRLVVQHMDGRSLRYEDGVFDGIVSLGSIEHFGDLTAVAQAAREMGRVLKPGGVLTLATELKLSPADGMGWPGVILFTPGQLEQCIIEPSGLEPVDAPEYDVSLETMKTAFPLARLVAGESRFPSLVMEHDGYRFGSVMMTLIKP
jgi:SAM-dependent methyltransferase